MDAATAYFYIGLGAVVLAVMCVLDAIVSRVVGPDRDLSGRPWFPGDDR